MCIEMIEGIVHFPSKFPEIFSIIFARKQQSAWNERLLTAI